MKPVMKNTAAVVRERRSWKEVAASLPGVAAALLPKIACPACWPAYAGLLSSLGLEFLFPTRHLFVLTVVFLVVALAALAWSVRRGRAGVGPFLVGLAAAAAILAGKFELDSNPLLYAGVGGLIAASAWVSFRRRISPRDGLFASSRQTCGQDGCRSPQ